MKIFLCVSSDIEPVDESAQQKARGIFPTSRTRVIYATERSEFSPAADEKHGECSVRHQSV
jgi:hypothetical protein